MPNRTTSAPPVHASTLNHTCTVPPKTSIGARLTTRSRGAHGPPVATAPCSGMRVNTKNSIFLPIFFPGEVFLYKEKRQGKHRGNTAQRRQMEGTQQRGRGRGGHQRGGRGGARGGGGGGNKATQKESAPAPRRTRVEDGETFVPPNSCNYLTASGPPPIRTAAKRKPEAAAASTAAGTCLARPTPMFDCAWRFACSG
jgi:hypothetical protein